MSRAGVWEELIDSGIEGRKERQGQLEDSQDGAAKFQEKKTKLD